MNMDVIYIGISAYLQSYKKRKIESYSLFHLFRHQYQFIIMRINVELFNLKNDLSEDIIDLSWLTW